MKTSRSVPRTGPVRRAARTIVALATTAALVAGCGGSSDDPDSESSGSAGGAREGGDVTFLIDSLGATWIPNNSAISSFQGHIWGHVTDKLIYVDEKGTFSPWLAESWEQNENATEFTLKLKEGVTFSDGEPLDAAAVVANLDIWAKGRLDDGINPIGLYPKTYDRAEAVDASTVKVYFKAPTVGFIPTLGYHGSILISPKTIASPATDQADLSKTIASGPFVVESWKEGDYVKLVKRKDYNWAPEALGHQGAAHLDSITYKLVAEPSLRVSSVQSGQADVAYNPSPQELEGLKSEGFTVAVPRYLGFTNGWAINTKVAPYDDVKVRQALQAGIDRQEIIDTVYTPDWVAAKSLFQSNVDGWVDHGDLLTFDPAKAESLLDQAGWVKGADGIRTKGGKQLSIVLNSNPYLAASKSIDELLAQQLGKLGWKVEITTYDVVTYGEKVAVGNENSPAYEITRSIVDAGTAASILTNANNGENWFQVDETDAKLNKLRDGIAAATSVDARGPLLDELQQYVLEQGYFIPRTEIVQRLYVQNPKLKDVFYNGLAYANYYAAYLTD